LANGRDLCADQGPVEVSVSGGRQGRNTVDFLLTAKRDRKAALRLIYKAVGQRGTPAKITIDQSGAHTAAIESCNAARDTGVEIRQVKYLNNVVEQDHRAIERQVRPMMGFKSFCSAAVTLAGIELMHMIRKDQLRARDDCVRRTSSIRWPADFHAGHGAAPPRPRIRDRTRQAAALGSLGFSACHRASASRGFETDGSMISC